MKFLSELHTISQNDLKGVHQMQYKPCDINVEVRWGGFRKAEDQAWVRMLVIFLHEQGNKWRRFTPEEFKSFWQSVRNISPFPYKGYPDEHDMLYDPLLNIDSLRRLVKQGYVSEENGYYTVTSDFISVLPKHSLPFWKVLLRTVGI